MRPQKTHRRLPLAAMAFLLVALLAACSPSTGGASVAASAAPPAAASVAPSSAAGGAGSVTIKDFAFSPASLTVAPGTTVTWTNQDSASHTVTADDGSFDSKPISSGASFSQAFPKAGTYTYHCSIHTSMTATVVVQ